MFLDSLVLENAHFVLCIALCSLLYIRVLVFSDCYCTLTWCVFDMSCVQEYSQTEVKVRSVLESLELTMKQLLESHDRKQKVCIRKVQCHHVHDAHFQALSLQTLVFESVGYWKSKTAFNALYKKEFIGIIVARLWYHSC